MTNEAGAPALDPDERLRQAWPDTHRTFGIGDSVRKVRGSQWHGRVVGWYSTELTPEGYAVESDRERGSVQIYPASALERAA
jgi:dihydrofolate reductase (trimethoprim resistance protein)